MMRLCRRNFQTLVKGAVLGLIIMTVIVQYSLVARSSAVCQCDEKREITTAVQYTTEVIQNANITTVPTTLDPYKPRCDPRLEATIVGKRRQSRGYMTIGIPSIYRPNTTDGKGYVNTTIHSLVSNLQPHEKNEVTILVFLSDFNETFKNAMIERLNKQYKHELEIGLLNLMTMPRWCYPKLENLTRTFNDAPDRVMWRSKQVVDYAFLWQISSNMSEYYMQLEDDVITCKDYLSQIKGFVNSQRKFWTMLEFAKLGYIGKFYKSKDLRRLARFVLTFYYNMPIDWLLGHFVKLMTQQKAIYSKFALFDHIGHTSSLHGSYNPLKEKSFKENGS